MDVGLCMVVKNEVGRLADCLDPIVDALDDIVIVDTGSEDGTVDLLWSRYRIEPLRDALDPKTCFCLRRPRQMGLRHLKTPWVLFLDADERISTSVLRDLKQRRDDPAVAGYFGRWTNHMPGRETFDDYKLFLFRAGLRPVGLVHDNVQLDIRRRGGHASWLDELTVQHYPDATREPHKRRHYRKRLDCAIKTEPEFLRYYWFRGYMSFLEGRKGAARQDLYRLAEAPSEAFPVECLNSAMVLAELLAADARGAETMAILTTALHFYEQVKNDFEVRVNRDTSRWLQDARRLAEAARLHEIRAPRFAC